ncbi:MAG: metalloregulator ArsR/SmtB family transcription factor [Proteobacteria bacterium]|nr:metalloregulator ArsR/SmtB family transcription factor [Pseudomonadota bacterium]MBU1715393.1 metalloregulator ArsR/SmtB family transcription factor [Pseudomonadota bacterium]
MKQFITAAKAIADPTRIKIIKLLQAKELCVCEIQAALALSQPTISNHMKILEKAEMSTSRKERNWVIYRLTADSANLYSRQFLNNIREWLDHDPEIKQLRLKLQTIDRLTICKK